MRPLRAIAARVSEVLGRKCSIRATSNCPMWAMSSCRTPSPASPEFTIDAQLRNDFAQTAEAHRAEVAAPPALRGRRWMTLRTDHDWIADTVRFVASRRRGAMAWHP